MDFLQFTEYRAKSLGLTKYQYIKKMFNLQTKTSGALFNDTIKNNPKVNQSRRDFVSAFERMKSTKFNIVVYLFQIQKKGYKPSRISKYLRVYVRIFPITKKQFIDDITQDLIEDLAVTLKLNKQDLASQYGKYVKNQVTSFYGKENILTKLIDFWTLGQIYLDVFGELFQTKHTSG